MTSESVCWYVWHKPTDPENRNGFVVATQEEPDYEVGAIRTYDGEDWEVACITKETFS